MSELTRRAAAGVARTATRPVGRGARIVNTAYALAGGVPETLMPARINGVRVSCNLREAIGHRIFYFGRFEPEFTKLLLAEARPDDVFFDVGANCGYYSLGLARRVGEVHAFEPNPVLVERLSRDAASNGMSVKVHPVALGDEPRTLNLAEGSDPTSPEGTRYLTSGEGDPVPVVRLDDYLTVAPSVVKIDVEGAELMALRGMSRMLREHRPRLVTVEAVPKHLARLGATVDEIRDFMAGQDYLATDFTEPGYDPVLLFRPR